MTSSLAHSWGWGSGSGEELVLIWYEGGSVSRGWARGKGGLSGLAVPLWW